MVGFSHNSLNVPSKLLLQYERPSRVNEMISAKKRMAYSTRHLDDEEEGFDDNARNGDPGGDKGLAAAEEAAAGGVPGGTLHQKMPF